jgi:hypothetical protein
MSFILFIFSHLISSHLTHAIPSHSLLPTIHSILPLLLLYPLHPSSPPTLLHSTPTLLYSTHFLPLLLLSSYSTPQASSSISRDFMAADIDNILKERSKEVTFTDNGYENVEDIFKLEEEADSGKQMYGYH